MSLQIEPNALVLFQGDSITNAFRNPDDGNDLGRGYAVMVAGWFGSLFAERGVRFLNRGVSGNTVRELEARWTADCVDLRPAWLSLLIGINDAGRRFNSNQPVTPAEFETTLAGMLSAARQRNGTRLVLCEPFLLPVNADYAAWREELNPKIEVVRKLARELAAVYVPLDGLFAAACARREPRFWAWDGVHPTPAGHALIAREWLRAVGAL